MKNLFYCFIALTCLFGFQSCGKDTDTFIPTTTTTTVVGDTIWDADLLVKNDVPTSVLPPLNIEKLMEALKTPPTRDTFSAERGGVIVTPDNVTVTFAPNSCVNANNTPCTGKLDVEILVIRKKGEFLLNNVPTSSLGKQLVSGGSVLVKVRRNGEEVRLARNTFYRIKYASPSEPDSRMLLFDGKFEGRFKFDWTPIARLNGDFPSWRPWGDSAQTRQRGYDLNLDRFNWVNCDVFGSDSTNLTNKFCVALPDSFTNQNTNAFVVFKDVNSVVALASDARVKQFCVPSTYRGLPIGRQVIIVTVSNIRDRIYIATKEATIIANTVLRMEPTITTKEALKTLIKNL